MGTNFYFYANDAQYCHIGKRSAAGMYCWDCGVTLCDSSFDSWNDKQLYGTDAVHYSGRSHWLERCPLCGKYPSDESLENSVAGRELGFNKTQPKKKRGVASCSSFSWAISPQYFSDLVDVKNITIRDEYGYKYTKLEFLNILRECPIKHYSSVDLDFS